MYISSLRQHALNETQYKTNKQLYSSLANVLPQRAFQIEQTMAVAKLKLGDSDQQELVKLKMRN